MNEDKPGPNFSRRRILAASTAYASAMIFPSTLLANPGQRPARAKVNLDHFVQDCLDANGESEAQTAVLDVLARAVHEPKKMARALPEQTRGGISIIHRSSSLTIFNASWTPRMNLMPHDHRMWANIGIYAGREDNIFWRRDQGKIVAEDADALFEGDVAMLAEDSIHSVTNPLLRFTGGIHIYGGDFFDTVRSEWNPETLDEEPSDGDKIRRMFERENLRLGI